MHTLEILAYKTLLYIGSSVEISLNQHLNKSGGHFALLALAYFAFRKYQTRDQH